MTIKILIADDEERWRRIVRDFLAHEGYQVFEAENGKAAVNTLRKELDISLVILDIMMPVMDGIAACKEIRSFSNVPVMMVTAREDEESEITGFQCGADEYVSKPIKMRAFMARVRAMIKRNVPDTDVLELGRIALYLSARYVCVDGNRISLTPKEYDLLYYLAQNKNSARTRAQVLQAVWNTDFYGDARTVDTHVKNLRMKLGEAGNIIRTVRTRGYMLEYNK